MSKMADLEYATKQWFKDHIAYMVMVVIVTIIGFLIYGQVNIEMQEKENRINTIEERLTKQEHYIHQVQADVDNLYRVVE